MASQRVGSFLAKRKPQSNGDDAATQRCRFVVGAAPSSVVVSTVVAKLVPRTRGYLSMHDVYTRMFAATGSADGKVAGFVFARGSKAKTRKQGEGSRLWMRW